MAYLAYAQIRRCMLAPSTHILFFSLSKHIYDHVLSYTCVLLVFYSVECGCEDVKP